MGAEVKKLEPRPATPPDGTKPIALKYWYSPFNPQTGIGMCTAIDAFFNDGMGTQGKVRSITMYPGGFVVIELACGWMLNIPDEEQKVDTRWVLMSAGQGVAL